MQMSDVNYTKIAITDKNIKGSSGDYADKFLW